MEASHGVYTAEGGVGWLGWLAGWENGDGTVVDGVWRGYGVPTMISSWRFILLVLLYIDSLNGEVVPRLCSGERYVKRL